MIDTSIRGVPGLCVSCKGSNTHRLRMAALALVLGASGLYADSVPAQGRPGMGSDSVPVVTVQRLVQNEARVEVSLPGRVSSFNRAQVRPQVGGILQERLFEQGAWVTKGDPLYRIDEAQYQVALAQSRAQLARAQALLESARVTADRLAELVRIKAASQQDYDNAQAELAIATALVQSEQAALASAQLDLDRTIIRAPISGRIGASALTPGELLLPNQAQPLAHIEQLDPVYVDLVKSSSQLLSLRQAISGFEPDESAPPSDPMPDLAGMAVTLTLENGAAYPHEGELLFSEAKVDPSTGTVNLRARFPNPQQLLLPGMYVQAHLSQQTPGKVIRVPQQALTRTPTGQAVVLILDEADWVEQREVTTTQTSGHDWLVTDGVYPGERVIVSGSQRIKPGMQARPLEGAR